MGQRLCCAQKRIDFAVDCLNDQAVPVLIGDVQPCLSRHPPEDVDVVVAEVARQIASDRRQQLFEAAALIPVLYEVRPPELDESQHICTVIHRKTGVVRQLSSFRKPVGAEAQESLRSFISALQRLSAKTETIAKVFEVFEDYVSVHLVLEQCTGGTVYERILECQYFTEQESSMLVKHMLLCLAPLHEGRMYHGNLTPHSFRFLNSSPHAPLKLVDFGLELKIHRWDAVEYAHGGPDLQNPHCTQFFETCKLVFCAPEFAPPYQPRRKKKNCLTALLCDVPDRQSNATCRATAATLSEGVLDSELLADIIDEHAEWFEQQQQENLACGYQREFEASDMWSLGAVAFLLLCGYPPFFAPSRNAILGRIHRIDFAYDPPFWSKISEEAKSFVTGCMQGSCWDRIVVQEALEHCWIQKLADNSPSGSMFSSFMLNLRRFYRTSLIEMYVANMLATRFRRQDMHDFLRRCREIDSQCSCFFTASDLKHVLNALGHGSISEAITARFLRAFRHPGESYIDYTAMLDSIYLRQERIFEEELWCNFQRLFQGRGEGVASTGRLLLAELGALLGDPVVVGLLMRELPDCAGMEEAMVCSRLKSSINQHCGESGATQIEFHDLVALLLKFVRSCPVVWQPVGMDSVEAPPLQDIKAETL